jgi:hypothetical protein
MVDVIAPSPVESVISEKGGMLQRFMNWTQDVTNALNFVTPTSGTGTPETVVSAKTGKFFTDTVVPNLYWKSVDDVAGDKTKGWLLVV